MRLIWKTLFRLTVISRLNFLHSVGPRLASSCVRETQKTMRTQEGGWTWQIHSSRSGGHDVTSVMVFEDFSMVALLKSVRAWLFRTFTPLHTPLSLPHTEDAIFSTNKCTKRRQVLNTHTEKKKKRTERKGMPMSPVCYNTTDSCHAWPDLPFMHCCTLYCLSCRLLAAGGIVNPVPYIRRSRLTRSSCAGGHRGSSCSC